VRRLASAWVIEVLASKRSTPVLEYPPETTLDDMRLRQFFRDIGEAEPTQCRV